MSDQLHPFLFEGFPVRGALAQLSASWQAIRRLREYPAELARLLGESVVASALLASTLKRSTGSLLIQIQGQGPVRLLVAECAGDYALRCTARWEGALAPVPLGELFGNGHCAITLGGGDAPMYQGIVPLESTTLAGALERYMQRSEQLETRIWLFAGTESAGGLLLQRVPQSQDADTDDAFHRAVHFAATVTADELHALSAPVLLRRLFPEDDVRLFSGRALRFRCSCTGERVRNMLITLGEDEVERIIAEQGSVEVTCEFCNQAYTFAPEQCRAWFRSRHH